MAKKHIEGKVTLELRDARTGKLEQRVEATNFISQSAIRFMNYQQRLLYKTGLTAIGSADIDYAPTSVFSHMMLTDSQLPEDPANEWTMSGKLIGWANKTSYAGTDTLRGTPNVTQVSAGQGFTKWVFDWPTNAANGTIGSVGWGKAVYANVFDATFASRFVINGSAEEYKTTVAQWRYLTRASSVLNFAYPTSAGTAIYVLDGDYAQTTTFNVNGQFASVQGLAWDSVNNKLWVLGTSGAVRRIASYNAAGVLQNGPIDLTTRAYAHMTFDGTSLWMAVSVGQNVTFHSVNPSNGNDVSNFTHALPMSSSVLTGMSWDRDTNRLWLKIDSSTTAAGHMEFSMLRALNTSGELQMVDVSLYAWVYGASSSNSLYLPYSPGWYYDFDVIDSYQFAVANYNGTTSRVVRFRPDGMGSRALLPSPVTKTNSQTLKLIYQINYS